MHNCLLKVYIHKENVVIYTFMRYLYICWLQYTCLVSDIGYFRSTLVLFNVVIPNTARTHAHTSISTLKSLVNFCSRDFLFHKEFDDSTLAKRHIVVRHFVRSDTSHAMQAIFVTRHSWITQQLVPSTTAISFVCCSQFACERKLLMTFGTTRVYTVSFGYILTRLCLHVP